MLELAFGFFVLSLVAAFLGFAGLSTPIAGVARLLFLVAAFVFVVLVVLSLSNAHAIR